MFDKSAQRTGTRPSGDPPNWQCAFAANTAATFTLSAFPGGGQLIAGWGCSARRFLRQISDRKPALSKTAMELANRKVG
jgi:hypothetical protein